MFLMLLSQFCKLFLVDHLLGGNCGNDPPSFPRHQIQRPVEAASYWFTLPVTFNGFRSPTVPKEAINMLRPLLTDEQRKKLSEVDETGSINLPLLAIHPRGETHITIHRTYAGKGSFKISRGWSELRDGNRLKSNGSSILDLWIPEQDNVNFVVVALRGLQPAAAAAAAASLSWMM